MCLKCAREPSNADPTPANGNHEISRTTEETADNRSGHCPWGTTQNLVGFTARVGSIPSSGTNCSGSSTVSANRFDPLVGGVFGECPCNCPCQRVELPRRLVEVGFAHDVVAIEHSARLVPRHPHRDRVRNAGTNEIAGYPLTRAHDLRREPPCGALGRESEPRAGTTSASTRRP